MRISILCLIIFSTLQIAFAVPYESGDVNGDGAVTHYDAMLIRNHLLETAALEGGELLRADANGDTNVTMADVIYVTTHLYKPEEVTVMLPGDVPLVMVKIPAGSFQMGAPDTERSRDSDEGPLHTVNINYDYYMGKYELTQQQWLAVMGSWPGAMPSDYGTGDNYPAYYISWNDCQNFITALNNHISSTGQGPANFRLPSEAEWEYACRAGTQTRFFFGNSLSVDDYSTDGPAGTLPGNRSDYMWFGFNENQNTNGIYGSGSHPVGIKLPNQFGLYDMSGNVWERCQDYGHSDYTGAPTNGSAWESPTSPYRVLRGGFWFNDASFCRSAYRLNNLPANRYHYSGVRLSRTQ